MSKILGYIVVTEEWEYDDNAYNLNGRVDVGSRLYRTREEANKAAFEANKAQFQQMCSGFNSYEYNFSEWGFRNHPKQHYAALLLKTRKLLAPQTKWNNESRARPQDFDTISRVDFSHLTDEDYQFLFDTWDNLNVARIHEIHEE